MSTARSDTTKHKLSTLPIGLYESEPSLNVDFNFLSFIRREANTQAIKENVISFKGTVFVRTEEEDMLIVTNWKTYMTVPIQYLQKSSRKTHEDVIEQIGCCNLPGR